MTADGSDLWRRKERIVKWIVSRVDEAPFIEHVVTTVGDGGSVARRAAVQSVFAHRPRQRRPRAAAACRRPRRRTTPRLCPVLRRADDVHRAPSYTSSSSSSSRRRRRRRHGDLLATRRTVIDRQFASTRCRAGAVCRQSVTAGGAEVTVKVTQLTL